MDVNVKSWPCDFIEISLEVRILESVRDRSLFIP